MKLLSTLLMVGMVLSGFAQTYFYLPSTTSGNPGGLNNDSEFPVGGGLDGTWTTILSGGSATASWSPQQTIPFTFLFAGDTVSQYYAGSSGVVTFSQNPGTAPGSTPEALPSSSLPDSTVVVWGFDVSGTNDNVVSKTFGTAGSRQHWIFFTSMSQPGTTCWHYWAVVLEEGTNNIYLCDMRNSCNISVAAGIQIDGTTATSVMGSPALGTQSDSDSSPADNFYYSFIWGVQNTKDIAGISMTGEPYNVLDNVPFDITGEVLNLGSDVVTSMTLNYSVNGGTAVSENLTGLNIQPYEYYSFTHGTGWSPTAVGDYTIAIWASDINGSVDQDLTNDAASGVMQVFDAYTQRTPLYETFTSSTCGPCVPANENLEQLFGELDNLGKYTSIKYQVDWPGSGDPYYTDEIGNRIDYYAINSVPRLEIDGGWDQNASNLTQELIDENYAKPSFADMQCEFWVYDQYVYTDVTVSPVSDFVSNNLVVHVAVFEYQTSGNVASNGETEFFHVVKKMLPDENGSGINALQAGVDQFVNETYTFAGDYRLPNNADDPIDHAIEHSVEEFSDLGVAAWIQDATTKEVLQSIEGTMVTGLREEKVNVLAAKIYPNPTTDRATIAFQLGAASSDVLVYVYDNFGRVVHVSRPDNYGAGRSTVQVETADWAPGMYTVQITNGTERLVRRLVVGK